MQTSFPLTPKKPSKRRKEKERRKEVLAPRFFPMRKLQYWAEGGGEIGKLNYGSVQSPYKERIATQQRERGSKANIVKGIPARGTGVKSCIDAWENNSIQKET